jgi:hypothetical protein
MKLSNKALWLLHLTKYKLYKERFQTISTGLNKVFCHKNILHIIYDKFQAEQMHKPAIVSTHISILILQ